MKTSDYVIVQGLLETPPRVRADSIQINSNQAQFNSIQFNSIQFNSIHIELELEMAVRVGLGIEKLLGNGCLSWVRLQKAQTQFEKIERAHY